ncbi:MAG: hypothetical protein QF552_08865 [Litorilituus sp.]|jgi:hypothetical protein|nr:hypothetical protein [Litorilituus sp.]
MKKLLILIVAIALFLHFYPQPEVTKFYNAQKNALIASFSEFSDTKIRLKADKIFTDLQPDFDRFSAREIKYLKEITASRSNVKAFYQHYCTKQKSNRLFHPVNQVSVCKTISHYQSML